MVFGVFKRIVKAVKKKLPYILVIVQPHPELSEAICGHRATPFHYDIVTLESTQINTDESDEYVRSSILPPPHRIVCTCSQRRQHEVDHTGNMDRDRSGPSFYCMIDGEDVKVHPPPFEILRRLKKEQTMADALDLEYKLKTGIIKWEEVAEMSMAESGIMSESEWGTVDTETPSAEWEHGYGGYLCDSGWPNSQWASTSRVSSSTSAEFPMRVRNRLNSGQHNYHKDAFESGHRNLAIASQLSSSSLVQVPTMPPRNNEPDRVDFELLELAMESLVRLQEILYETSEGEAQDIYADVPEAEGSGAAN